MKESRIHALFVGSKICPLLLCSLLVCLCLQGCGQPEGDNTISFLVFGDPAEFAAYEKLVTVFANEHPEIKLELSHVPDQHEYRRRLATQFSAGNPPDVMLMNYRRFAVFADEGGLEPLGPYLEQSRRIQESDFFPSAIEGFYYEGQLWCIPQNVSSLVVYYNRDLFQAAGLPYPGHDWTWSDFLSLARALTQDLEGDGQIDQYGVGISPKLIRLAPFVWQNGGEIVDNPDNPARLALDGPAALAALQWVVDLQVREGVAPDALAEAAESSEVRFLRGRLAMYLNSRRGVPTYRTITSFGWDVAPLPAGPRGAAGILHSDGFCMAAKTEHKDAAWTFIEFANSVEGQELLAATGRTVPSVMAVARSSAFLEPDQPPANTRVFVDTVPLLQRVPVMTTWATIEEITNREIERAFYGQASVEEAVATAIFLTQPYFDEAAGGR